MSIPYPDKPWEDNQTFKYTNADGEEFIGTYNASKNSWTFVRVGQSGTGGGGIVTTADVKTLNARPARINNPFSLTDDPNTIISQQEANWWILEDLAKKGRKAIVQSTAPTSHPLYTTDEAELIVGDLWVNDTTKELYWYNGSEWELSSTDRPPIVSPSVPTEHPKFPGEPLQEGDIWFDDSDGARMSMYAWDEPNGNWVPVGDAGRPPIFSQTEPTEHPDFGPPNNQLETGDYWYDTSDPDEIVSYIYDGTNWLKVGGDFVRREGGDSMQGPLKVSGGRDPDANGIESTIQVLNVDSGQNSTLNLKHQGNTKVYVGDTAVSFSPDIKFTNSGHSIYTGTVKKGLTINTNGVFYEGDYFADKHITTKKKVEEAIQNVGVNIDISSSAQNSIRAGLDDLVAPRVQIVSEDPNFKNSSMFENAYSMFPGKDDYQYHHVDQRFILLSRMYEGKKDPPGSTVNRETIDSNEYGNDDLPNLAIQDLKTGKLKYITTATVRNEAGTGDVYPAMRGCHLIANENGSCNAYLWIHNPMRTVRQSGFSNNACPLFRIFIPAEEDVNDSDPFANFVFKWTNIRCDKTQFTTPAVNPYTLKSDINGSEKFQYEIQTQTFHLRDERNNKRYIFMSYNKGVTDYVTQRLFEVKFSSSGPDDGVITPIEAHADSDNGPYAAGLPAIKKTVDGGTKCFLFGTPVGLTELYFVPDGADTKLQLRNYNDYIPLGARVEHPTEVNAIGQPLIVSKGIIDNWDKNSSTQPQWLTEGLWDESNPFSTRLVYFQSSYGIVSIPTEDIGNKADEVKLENNFKGDINSMHIETRSNLYANYMQQSSTKNLSRFSTGLMDTRSNGSVWFFDYKANYITDNTAWYNDTREFDNSGNVTFKYEFKRCILEVRPNIRKGNIEIIGHSIGRRRSDNGLEEGNVTDFCGESICKMYDQFVCVGAAKSHSTISKARVHIFDPFTKNISLVSDTEVNASTCIPVPQRGIVALSDYGIDANDDPTTMYYVSMLSHAQDTINIRKSASILRTLYGLTGTDVATAEDTWTLDAPVAPGIPENRSEPEEDWDEPQFNY